MNINKDIAGWTSVSKLEFLANAANEVTENGCIVEIGSLVGRSAYALGMNKKDSVKLCCIDMFPEQGTPLQTFQGADSMLGNKDSDYSYYTFMHNMLSCVNLHTIRMHLPINSELIEFKTSIDLLFIDCVHTYDAVKHDIEYWAKLVKPTGTIVFDDYFDMFPGTIKAVDEYIKENNFKSTVVDGTSIAVFKDIKE